MYSISYTTKDIYKSTDGGATWSVYATIDAADMDAADAIVPFEDVVFVTLYKSGGAHVLYRSDDMSTWTRVFEPAAGTVTHYGITRSAYGSYYLALYDDTVSDSARIYVSTDGGATWALFDTVPLPAGGYTHHYPKITQAFGNWLYVGFEASNPNWGVVQRRRIA